MNADEEMENTDPTENAAMAEDFGKTIKNVLFNSLTQSGCELFCWLPKGRHLPCN